MRVSKIVAIACLVTLSTGCAFKHKGYAKASVYYRSMMSSVLSDPSWYGKYYNETDPEKKKELRDRLIGYCIWLVDEDFNTYAAKFSRNQAVSDLVFDVSSLAVSGASVIATPAEVYGAIATGIQGAHSSYSKDMLDQQTRGAILLKMDALRQEQLIAIYRSEQLPDSQYSLIQGLIDVQKYVNAGTVHTALAAISQDASIQHQNAAEVLRSIRKPN